MTVTICGSISFMDEMRYIKKQLLKFDIKEVRLPFAFGKNDRELKAAMTDEEDAERKIKYDLINKYYKKILTSDAVIIANYDKNDIKNYIGGNTLLEMGFAFVNRIPTFLLNPIPRQPYTPEIRAMKPINLNGRLEKIVKYMNQNRYTDLFNLY